MNDTKTAALVAEVDRLTKELAEAKRGAERYRWLRDTGDETWRPFVARTGYSGEQLDYAIDAAMRRTDAGAKTV